MLFRHSANAFLCPQNNRVLQNQTFGLRSVLAIQTSVGPHSYSDNEVVDPLDM